MTLITDAQYYSALPANGLDLAQQQAEDYLAQAETDPDEAYPVKDAIVGLSIIEQVRLHRGDEVMP
jgi:hypothetical protein